MKKLTYLLLFILVAATACQKLSRPDLILIPDPPKPPYTPLKSFWQFDGNTSDSGENKFVGVPTAVTYGTGVSGQAYQGSATSNLVIATPGDTINNLGSFTISMWLNSGPATSATGLFAVSNKTQFWGNLEIFFEGYSVDATTAYVKVHMYNKNKPAATTEAWNEFKIPNFFGKWSHLVVTYDGNTSTFKLIANGVTHINSIIQSGTYGPIGFSDTNGMVLGTFAFMTTPTMANHGAETWARNYTGLMDQFRIYNQALSEADVNTLYTTKK